MTPTPDGVFYTIMFLLVFGFGCYWALRLIQWWKDR